MNSLASDNFSGVHPEVLKAIEEANRGHAIAYGGDPWTQKAHEVFQATFGPSAEAFIVHNGTAANICAMKQVLRSWQGVLCPESAHMWTDECGAASAITGCTLLPLPAKEGKLQLDTLNTYLPWRGNEHHVQPAAISITQSTEFGTVYSLEELRTIAAFAKKHKLLLHVDGARLSNAAAALNVSLKALSADIGVDFLSFGGTKNGLMGADAIVFFKPELAENFQYLRKQHLQLASKMRFLAAQFIALLENDLWLKNARHSNEMAKFLEKKLRAELPELPILYPVQANTLFVKLPASVMHKLQEKCFFWIWDEQECIVRWMTTWDTNPEFLEGFVRDLKGLLKDR